MFRASSCPSSGVLGCILLRMVGVLEGQEAGRVHRVEDVMHNVLYTVHRMLCITSSTQCTGCYA